MLEYEGPVPFVAINCCLRAQDGLSKLPGASGALRKERNPKQVKGATSRFTHLEKSSLHFSLSFVIRVNLLLP